MHTNVILTNKRRRHAQSNYTDTKLKAWFRRLLRHLARKQSGLFCTQEWPILHPWNYMGAPKSNCYILVPHPTSPKNFITIH